MKKIDHVRKTVYIIVGILTIISLVFSLCKKVGLCASSDSSAIPFDSLPYIVGNGVGMDGSFSDSVIQTCLDYAITWNPYFTSGDTAIVVPFNSGQNLAVLFPSRSPVTGLTFGSNFTVNYYYSYAFTSDGTPVSSATDAYFIITVNLVYETINGVSYYKSAISDYPVYVYNPENYVTDGGIQIFSDSTDNEPPFSGHTKGGVLSNYIDSHNLLEDSSDIPHVDVTPPADPTTNNLLQKILNGLGVLNGSIQGGVLTIGDYIGQGFENVLNWFTEPFDSEQFNSDLNEIALINDFSNLKIQVENCGMFDWSDVTPAQSLSFTFDVGGAVLPHTSCVIDFSWYTGTVKNICVAVICTFLVLGLLVTIINQLPNIIGGKSGDKGGGSDS